jgi:hypothetical protein
LLAEAGRVLVETPTGFVSGYDDTVAARLAADRVGVLESSDAAVLTLVLLHAVAIPRARGEIPAGAEWSVAVPVDRERLKDSKLPGVVIDASLRRLQDRGILRPGGRPLIVPGPQFARLTAGASRALFEELVLLAEPTGTLADSIRRRRTARIPTSPLSPPADPGADAPADQPVEEEPS